MLTDKNLELERPHLVDGVQRLYKVGRYRLSCINSPMLHDYPFAWEIAVLRDDDLVYDTPLTKDGEIFETDKDANEFIEKAFEYFEKQGETNDCEPES